MTIPKPAHKEENIPLPIHSIKSLHSLLNCSHFVPDLKAFERRLTEYVSCLQPATGRWRSKYLCWLTKPFDSCFIWCALCIRVIALNSTCVHYHTQDYKDTVSLDISCAGYIVLGKDFMFLHWVSFSGLVSVILIVVSVCTATGAWNWLIDPDTQKVRLSGRTCLWLWQTLAEGKLHNKQNIHF